MPAGITEEEGSGGEWNTFLHIQRQHTHIVYSSSLDVYRQHKIALSYWVTKTHQNKQNRVVQNLAEVDCLRQVSIKVYII